VLAGTSSDISSARKHAHENLKKQAKRMQIISDAKHPPVDVGGNAILPTPDVNRAKADLRNLVGVVHSSVICQTTGPKPLPKRFLHLMPSRASSFK
jgi:hypothetical protein